MTCSVSDCSKPVRARGLCITHYTAMRRAGGERVRLRSGICVADDCERPTHGKGLCLMHYRRVQRTGDVGRGRKPAQPRVPRPKPTPMERFMAKVVVDDAGCWLWQGHVAGNGYGRFSVEHRRSAPAHRWIYEQINGTVAGNLVMDHLCRVRSCVNPSHVEPVPQRTNLARGVNTKTNVTHCPRGHPYAGDNLYVSPNGARQCRTCQRDRKVARRTTGFHGQLQERA